MHTIYVDTLLCVNLFIDYILLNITRRVLHIRSLRWKILVAALLGAVSSLSALIPFYSVSLSALWKISTATVMTYIAFGKSSFRNYCIRFLTFLGFSMIMSSSVVLSNNLMKTDKMLIYNDVIYFDISPLAMLITTGCIYFGLIIYSKLSENKLRCEIHQITISTDHINNLTFESALDTGCNLKEPFSGLPVILTEEDIFETSGIRENKLRVIPFSTISGSDIILGFKPKSVKIDGRTIEDGCYIGICKNKLKGEIKSIMGQELLEV